MGCQAAKTKLRHPLTHRQNTESQSQTTCFHSYKTLGKMKPIHSRKKRVTDHKAYPNKCDLKIQITESNIGF